LRQLKLVGMQMQIFFFENSLQGASRNGQML
jgi:hypothetical protein